MESLGTRLTAVGNLLWQAAARAELARRAVPTRSLLLRGYAGWCAAAPAGVCRPRARAGEGAKRPRAHVRARRATRQLDGELRAGAWRCAARA